MQEKSNVVMKEKFFFNIYTFSINPIHLTEMTPGVLRTQSLNALPTE